MAIRRRSQFRNRINKMQGLPIEEKMMLLRMGEIIDGAINNRTPTNPDPNRGHIKRKKGIPQPSGLAFSISTRGATLSWSRINSDNLLNYKIRITPVGGEGEELQATSYTNTFLFKGRAGKYLFSVQAIGRDSSASEYSAAIEFQIEDAPMILEGNKFPVETLGAQLSETVLTPLNYTVFAFASVVLNTFSDPNDNPSVVLELRRGATYAESVFVQQFDLYPESEDLCNFDDAVGIFRPAAAPVSSGTFQTTQSVMFTPYQILESTGIADQNTTFWITVTSHGEDVVGMSCAIWVASEGLSEEVAAPGSVVHDKCIDIPVGVPSDLNRAFIISTGSPANAGDSEISNIWTFSIWVKPQDITTADFRIYHTSRFAGVGNSPSNHQRVMVAWDTGTPRLECQVWNNAGTSSVLWTKNTSASVWPLGINEWHLLTVCFSGERSGSKFDVYINGALLSPDSDTSTATTIPPYTITSGKVWAIGGIPTGDMLARTGAVSSGEMDARVHSAGLWNVVLSASAISNIYNGGNGAVRDWRTTFGAYGQALSLIHYWWFGSLENTYTGPPEIDWVKKGPFGGTASQAEVDFNVANDVSFDLGNMQDVDSLYHPLDFTNRIFITQTGGAGDSSNRQSIGGMGDFTTLMTDAGDIVDDYPGA